MAEEKKPQSDVPAGHFRNAKGLVVAEKYRGTKSYVCTQQAYHSEKLYGPGDRITLTDETPSKTFRPLEAEKPAAPDAKQPQGRAADKVV